MASAGKVVYLPAIYDPKKLDEGITEILYLIQTMELAEKEDLAKKEVS